MSERVLKALVTHVVVLALVVPASGCLMTTGDGEKLRDETNDRITQLETQSKQDRAELEAKLKELQSVLDQATEVLKRGSADVGAQVEQLRDQLNTSQGQLAELQHRLDSVDQQLTAQRSDIDTKLAAASTSAAPKPAVDPSQIPPDKAAHFAAAYQAYQNTEYDKARALWREYITRYPNDPKAGEAQYWIGAAYTQQNKPAAALGEYRKVISDYAKSTAVKVALYGMADAFWRLKACTDAKSAVGELLKRKPEASLADRAKKLQKDISSAPRGYCTN
jgi:TolA-binding protein